MAKAINRLVNIKTIGPMSLNFSLSSRRDAITFIHVNNARMRDDVNNAPLQFAAALSRTSRGLRITITTRSGMEMDVSRVT